MARNFEEFGLCVVGYEASEPRGPYHYHARLDEMRAGRFTGHAQEFISAHGCQRPRDRRGRFVRIIR